MWLPEQQNFVSCLPKSSDVMELCLELLRDFVMFVIFSLLV